jgi:hypothetical protein
VRCEAHDARGEVDGESGDVIAAAFDFAGVQSGPNVEPEVVCVADDLGRAAHALGGPGEEGQRAVAGRLDRLPAVGPDGGACGGEVTVEHARPRSVSRMRGAAGGVDEVGEEHGRQDAARGRSGLGASDELLEDVGDELHVERDEHGVAGDLAQARARDEIGELTHDLRRDERHVARVDDERRCLDQRKGFADVARE